MSEDLEQVVELAEAEGALARAELRLAVATETPPPTVSGGPHRPARPGARRTPSRTRSS